VPLFQVEETAFLLQIHEKRPPPRGPFPWAEGYLTGIASDPGLAFFKQAVVERMNQTTEQLIHHL
jgi:hypothetical protein